MKRNLKIRDCILLTLIVVTLLAFPVMGAMEVKALGETSLDISTGNLVCNDPDTLYRITGTSKTNHITIRGGRESKPIKVDLNGVNIDLHRENDGDSIEAAPITIESNSYVILYIGKENPSVENYLYGGNKHGIGKNSGYAGLCIKQDAHVTISGFGKLTVHGGGVEYGAAGIGGNYNESVSDLVIDGYMKIDATGAHSAPGIGAGRDGELYNLTIKNGNITAQGGKYAPGIGAGDAVGTGSGGDTHNITISGGMIRSTGGYHAAGIGGSEGGKVGKITISGGDVTAFGGENGAGIGSEAGDCSEIAISGGAIEATGGENGAGIGSGRDAKMTKISISNGIIEATGGKNAAGIGSGNHVGGGDGGNLEELSITGGNITATGGENGAGIGGGDGGAVSKLTISNSRALEINATGGENGAGIGSANHAVGEISISMNGNKITAIGGKYGAGIGGGAGDTGKISITGSGTIIAKGGTMAAGIGGGKHSQSGEIGIYGNEGRTLTITAEANYDGTPHNGVGNEAAAIGSGRATGGNITIQHAKLNLKADGCGAAIGSGRFHGTATGSIHKISIDDCEIQAAGVDKTAAGIGAGEGAKIDSIEIKNSEYSGGVIGSSCYPNHFFENPNGIKDITIENSTIYAEANPYAKTNWAGIGSGPWGSVDSIKIKDSDVTAVGADGGAGIGTGGWVNEKTIVEYIGGNMGDIEITGSKVKASATLGGAGIGGGFSTSVGDVTIKDSTVTATSDPRTGDGGAGIGGGAREGAGNIRIQNSTVTATGGLDSAGIGTSGEGSLATTMFNTRVKGIYISDHSKVTATGGENGAGIGTGKGGRISDKISITDSEVIANGGKYAAGIGGGANGSGGRGADLEALTLRGKCKITATGGVGGAGIGGGMDGAANNIDISLTTTADRAYYVKATGGTGAAGIGSGGIVQTGHEVFTPTGHTTDHVTISGGYIVARGGGLLQDGYYRFGSGAGIGGGARYGVLQNLTISGGYVEAYAGGSDACDIGHGGSGGLDPLVHDKNFKITGGTVLANRWSGETTPTIDGGSVPANLKDVKNSAGKKVYRTTLTLAQEANTPVEKLTAIVNSYGSKDIFTDGNQKIYLYLPQSAEKESWADVTVNGEKRHYYGTTSTDGNGVLKMDGTIRFKAPEEEVAAGNDFVLQLEDAALSGREYTFTVSGAASLVEVQQATSPGAAVKLHANKLGNYRVTATAKSNAEDPVYWTLKGEYPGNITKTKGTIRITENPSKTYDGQAVTDPEVETNSDGAVTYTYYAGSNADGTALTGAPVNAGTYTVVAKVKASEHYAEASSEPYTFTIEKRAITLGLQASTSGSEVELVMVAVGAVDVPGNVSVSVKKDGTETVLERESSFVNVNGEYRAGMSFPKVASAEYQVTVTYKPATPENYTCTNSPVEQTFVKNKTVRSVQVPAIGTKTYGDESFVLQASTNEPLPTDAYRYEVVYDEFPNLADAVTVDSKGKVTIQNAGRTCIKVTLVDTTGQFYEDAVTYVQIPVQRAPLHVTSYAMKNGSKVTEAQYGALGELEYGLEYAAGDFKNGDTEADFNRGLGTLKTVPLHETLGVGDEPYEIEIAKVGADFKIGEKTYSNVFVSRNYNLIFTKGTVAVTPAELKVQAEDAQGKWGSEPTYRYQVSGLIPWDFESTVFEELPVAGLDLSKTDDKAYSQLEPGDYPDAISVTKGTIRKNSAGKENYTVTTSSGDLTIGKADADLSLSMDSKTYDGKPVPVTTTTADGYDGTLNTVYYRVTAVGNTEETTQSTMRRAAKAPVARSNEAGKERLEEAPVNAGDYYVEVTAPETDHFTGETKGVYFSIQKAEANPDLPELPNLEMKDGLRLKDQTLPAGWEWVQPDLALQVGDVRAEAIYTPEDTENYESVTRELTFRVVAKDSGDDGNTNPGKPVIKPNGSSGGGKTPGAANTGDSSDLVLWLTLLLAAAGSIIAVVVGRKRSE